MQVYSSIIESLLAEQQKAFTFKHCGILLYGQIKLVNQSLHLSVRFLRNNLYYITMESSLLKSACGIMNDGFPKSPNRLFIVDHYTKSLCYIYKIMLKANNLYPESFSSIFVKVEDDLKKRVNRNLMSFLVSIGEVYSLPTKSKEVISCLKIQENLTKLLSYESNVQEMEVEASNKSCVMEVDDIYIYAASGPQKYPGFVKEGGYFRVYNQRVKVRVDEHYYMMDVVVKYSKNGRDYNNVARIKNELEIVKALKGNQYFPTYIIPKGQYSKIYMKYTTKYNLKDAINYKPFYPLSKRLDLTIDVVRGLKSIHDSSIVHRDIKPANFIIERDMSIKIIDFAYSFNISAIKQTNLNRASTMPYAAPEMLSMEKDYLCPGNDLWALGVVVYEIIERQMPIRYSKAVHNEFYRNLVRYSPTLHEESRGGLYLIKKAIRNLTYKLIKFNIEERVNLAEVYRILVQLKLYAEEICKISSF